MSYDIYFTIRQNFKSSYYADTLFFGKQKFYDYKKIVDETFDTYDEAVDYIYEHKISDCHIRRTLSTGGGCSHKDFKWRFK